MQWVHVYVEAVGLQSIEWGAGCNCSFMVDYIWSRTRCETCWASITISITRLCKCFGFTKEKTALHQNFNLSYREQRNRYKFLHWPQYILLNQKIDSRRFLTLAAARTFWPFIWNDGTAMLFRSWWRLISIDAKYLRPCYGEFLWLTYIKLVLGGCVNVMFAPSTSEW